MLETLNEIYWRDPEDFERRWPCSPWYKFEKPIESSYESLIEETVGIDWGIRLCENIYGEATPILGRTKERVKEERRLYVEAALERIRNKHNLGIGQIFMEGSKGRSEA